MLITNDVYPISRDDALSLHWSWNDGFVTITDVAVLDTAYTIICESLPNFNTDTIRSFNRIKDEFYRRNAQH